MFLPKNFFLLLLAMISVGTLASNVEVIELPHDEPQEQVIQKQWHLGIGNYFDLPQETQVSASGEKQGLTLWPLFSWGRQYQGILTSNYFLAWDVVFSLPQDVGSSDLTRTLLCLELAIGKSFDRWGSVALGLGFFQQFLYFKEQGESTTEAGSNSTFYRPSKLVVVSQETLNVTYSIPIVANQWWIEGKGYIFSLWENQKRATSYSLLLQYHW